MMKACFLLLLVPLLVNADLNSTQPSNQTSTQASTQPPISTQRSEVQKEIDILHFKLAKLSTVGKVQDKSIIGSGLVGVSADDLKANYSNEALERNEICAWHGSAPLCKVYCQDGFFEAIRLKAPSWNSTTFGSSCWSGKKSFCCKRDLAKLRWTGRWLNYINEKEMWSIYSTEGGRCGSLKFMEGGQVSISTITGDDCNKFTLFGKTAIAKDGYIKILTLAQLADPKYVSFQTGSAEVVNYTKNDDLSI